MTEELFIWVEKQDLLYMLKGAGVNYAPAGAVSYGKSELADLTIKELWDFYTQFKEEVRHD